MEKDTSSPSTLSLGAEFPAPSLESWRQLVDKVLKGADFNKRLVSRTDDGITIAPLSTRVDWPGSTDPGGFPGQAPFTRGRLATGHSAYGWDIRQRHDTPDPTQANKAILADLERGVTSLLLHLDTDGSGAGIRTSDLASLDKALDGVFLDLAPIALEVQPDGLTAAALLIALWDKRGLSGDAIKGALNLDPIGARAAYGTAAPDLETTLKESARLAGQVAAGRPHVTSFCADTRPYHLAGASEAQELAAALSTGTAYLKAMEAKGLDLDTAARQIAFTLTADTDQFLTIAKARALRTLWNHLTAACGISEPARGVTLHMETAARMMTARDPYVNILRTSVACFAAACGGADSITVTPFTAALGRPDGFARRIARNTQIILMEESGLARIIDPAGGAWSVERLTDDLCEKAWEAFQELEKEGGLARSLAAGSFQSRLEATHEKRLARIVTRRDPLTGVSEYPLLDEPIPPVEAPHAEYAPAPQSLPRHRLSAPFEALRDAADAFAKKTGTAPRACLITLGRQADYTARAGFARNLLAAGGIESIETGEQTSPSAYGDAVRKAGTPIAVLCAKTEDYAAQDAGLTKALKDAGVQLLLGAGRSAEFTTLTIDDALYQGCDAHALLARIHQVLEATATGESK